MKKGVLGILILLATTLAICLCCYTIGILRDGNIISDGQSAFLWLFSTIFILISENIALDLAEKASK